MHQTSPNKSLSRRSFLQRAGLFGGSAALYAAAAVLGAIPGFATQLPLNLGPARAHRKVVILGAGVSGLLSAWKLQEAGYEVEVIEASHRIGGRSLTLRHGDLVDEIGNRQICQFDDAPHLFFNAGPTRIPTFHENLLQYCRELKIPLEPFINDNPAAWIQFDGFRDGQRIRQSEYATNVRGFIAELLGKSVSRDWIDAPINSTDMDLLREFVAQYGDLRPDGSFAGSDRAGYSSGGMLSPGVPIPPLPGRELFEQSERRAMGFAVSADRFLMMHPVGGMDRIVQGFADKVSQSIRLNAQVVSITTSDERVEVTYRQGGEIYKTSGDYCLNSIPGQLLSGIPNNFTPDFQQMLAKQNRGKLAKIAFQARTRFWEQEGIYGGISYTDSDIGSIMYPPEGFNEDKGVLVGGYFLNAQVADKFTFMSADERIAMAVRQGEKLHPGYASQVENGVSVAWFQMNHMLGCSATGIDEETSLAMRTPQGRHFLIGDQVAMHAGWQESAIRSAHDAMNAIHQREYA